MTSDAMPRMAVGFMYVHLLFFLIRSILQDDPLTLRFMIQEGKMQAGEAAHGDKLMEMP